MGSTVQLKAADGHTLDAYVVEPSGKVKGAVVVIQEIFGVNANIKRITDQYASKGYLAIAPAMFDRAEKGVDLGYNEKTFAKGRELAGKLTNDMKLADVKAAVDYGKKAGKVGLVGYCFGGSVAWLSAVNNVGLSCSVGLYGGGVAATAEKDKPLIPVQLHFGDKDAAIPLGDLGKIKAAHPDVPLYVYDDSGHGFCCDDRDSFNPGACQRATERSLAFFAKHLA